MKDGVTQGTDFGPTHLVPSLKMAIFFATFILVFVKFLGIFHIDSCLGKCYA